jgi:hypothetical protein
MESVQNSVSRIQVDRIPHYEIDWSPESGWRVQVAIHDSTMYNDHMRKTFEHCDNPQHAFALANAWVKENLPTCAGKAKSSTASQR